MVIIYITKQNTKSILKINYIWLKKYLHFLDRFPYADKFPEVPKILDEQTPELTLLTTVIDLFIF